MIGYWIGAAVGIATLLVLYTKVIFDYATIKAEIQTNTTILKKLELLFSKYGDRIDDLEDRLLVIETQHGANHKGA